MAFYRGPNVVTNGLVLCLDAANTLSYPGSGTVWSDLSGNSNTGTLTNGPTFNSGNGGSIVFDGTNDYVTGFSNVSFSTTLPFSCELWFNLTSFSLSPYPALLQVKTNTASSFIIFISQTAGYTGFSIGSSSSWSRIKTDNAPNTNIWNHVIVTYNGSGASTNSNYQVYLNNTQQTLSNANLYNSTAQTNYIGSTDTVTNFVGGIANVKIYNRALSAAEVQQNYEATKTRFGL